MYEINQRETDGALIISGSVENHVMIKTEEITRFLNELCENDMISEGSKYEELFEENLLLKVENEKLKDLKEPSDFSNVSGSWVSVKDRLPNRDTKCLVYRPIGLIDIEYFYFDSKSFSGDYQPSHYMPLPPKPIDAQRTWQ